MLDTLLLTVNINVPQAVALRVVGATGSEAIARIHLGTVSPTTTTRSDPFGVRIWSTAGYRVNLLQRIAAILCMKAIWTVSAISCFLIISLSIWSPGMNSCSRKTLTPQQMTYGRDTRPFESNFSPLLPTELSL